MYCCRWLDLLERATMVMIWFGLQRLIIPLMLDSFASNSSAINKSTWWETQSTWFHHLLCYFRLLRTQWHRKKNLMLTSQTFGMIGSILQLVKSGPSITTLWRFPRKPFQLSAWGLKTLEIIQRKLWAKCLPSALMCRPLKGQSVRRGSNKWLQRTTRKEQFIDWNPLPSL